MSTPKFALVCLLLLLVPGLLPATEIGGGDIRIGSESNARSAILAFDPGTLNLFAVIEWTDGWSFYISTDGGDTWEHHYRNPCSQGYDGLDMVVSGTWVYVGYTCSNSGLASRAKMRRFALDTGIQDTGYTSGGHEVIDTDPQTIVDTSVETFVDIDGEKVFYALIQSDGLVRTFWDFSTDGTQFSEVPLNVFDAQGGLDIHRNQDFDTYSLFLSVVNEGGSNIEVWRFDGAWTLATDFAYNGDQSRSAVAAYDDQVAVAYLASESHGQGLRYRHSTDAGDTWSPGMLIAEPTAGAGDFLDVDMTARGGEGLAIVYNLEAGESDLSLFQYKPSFAPGPWTGPRSFNDFDSVTGLPIALNTAPAGQYGVIYVGGEDFTPYFDLLDPAAVFLAGFETGDTSEWSFTDPRWPSRTSRPAATRFSPWTESGQSAQRDRRALCFSNPVALPSSF